MRNLKVILFFISSVLIFLSCQNQDVIKERIPYKEEINSKINRGIVVFAKNETINFISWRKLVNDVENQTYFLWRKTSESEDEISKIAELSSTFFYDSINTSKNVYYGISTSMNEVPTSFERANIRDTNNYDALIFNLDVDYKQVHVVTGDLNGDGELELLIDYSKMPAVDPFEKAWQISTDSYHLIAFTKYGEKLWEKDLGFGIEAGKNYSPIILWDLDGDSKSEVILKTNKSSDPRDYSKEYLSILNGENGKLIRETRWPNPASENYNSNSRNYLAIAHIDGVNPSIIVGRGLYFTQIICEYDLFLNKKWERILGKDIPQKFENKYLQKIWKLFFNDESRGSHSLPIADVDENGTEEIFWGEHVITSNGEDLWKVEEKIPYSGHLDIVFPADLIKEKPGLETYYCREGWGGKMDNIGMHVVDKNGKIIWANWGYTHIDGGWAAKVIPNSKATQFFAYDVQQKNWKPGEHSFQDPNQILFDINGKKISNHDTSWIGSFTIDWEGDGIKEICTKDGELKRYNDELILLLKKGILWAGDLWGDHREEIVYAPQDRRVYIIFNTSKLNNKPQITKLADRQYKNDLSRTSMAFNVIPTECGYIPTKTNKKK
ncbi:MAG: hypothetical protein IPM32_03160 [Ignavibacteriae bacterium]|nr:hypothetical protein [Ignavibacteriota bacterium]